MRRAVDLLSSIVHHGSTLSCARIISDDRVNNSRGQTIVPDNPCCRIKDFDELHEVHGRIVQFDRWQIATDRTWLRSFDAHVTSTHLPRADESPARARGTVSWALFRRSRSRTRRFRHRARSHVSTFPADSHNLHHAHIRETYAPQTSRFDDYCFMSRDATRLSAVRYDALRWNTVNLRSALPIEIQLSSASETRMISIESPQKRIHFFLIEFSVFDVIEKNVAIYLILLSIFISCSG